jgi:hypothetical protein
MHDHYSVHIVLCNKTSVTYTIPIGIIRPEIY